MRKVLFLTIILTASLINSMNIYSSDFSNYFNNIAKQIGIKIIYDEQKQKVDHEFIDTVIVIPFQYGGKNFELSSFYDKSINSDVTVFLCEFLFLIEKKKLDEFQLIELQKFGYKRINPIGFSYFYLEDSNYLRLSVFKRFNFKYNKLTADQFKSELDVLVHLIHLINSELTADLSKEMQMINFGDLEKEDRDKLLENYMKTLFK